MPGKISDEDKKELEEMMKQYQKQGGLSRQDFAQLTQIMKDKKMPGSFLAVEDPNSEEGRVAQEYIDYHKKLPKTYPPMPEKKIAWAKKVLFSKNSLEKKKLALLILGHVGRPDVFEVLEKYEQNPDPDLKIWTNLAIQECQTFLKTEIDDEAAVDVVKVSKVGRNEPCSCGSGKKFKKCCG